MTLSLAMVLVRGEPGLAPDALRASFARLWSNVPPPTDVTSDDATLSFDLGDARVALGFVPAPIPASELEGPCATSRSWKNASKEVASHTHHVIVTVQQAEDVDPIERAELLTVVTAAVLDACPPAIGVYWGDAALVLARAFFLERTLQVLPEGPPVELWVDVRVSRDGRGSRGFTRGLAALGHLELESESASDSPQALEERLEMVCGYLLENGPVLEDGHTIGRTEDEKIRVRYGASSYGGEGTVMHLDYESPPKKRWWPFGSA